MGTAYEIEQVPLSCVEVNVWIYTSTAYLSSWHVEVLHYTLSSIA